MGKKLGSFILELLQVVVFAISIFLFVYLLILQPHKIKGSSMEPNFHDGEYLLTDKVTYRFGEPKRGDVIVFKAPPLYKDEFIKRIIGVPGDEIKVENNHVFVNGRQLNETYLPDNTPTRSGQFTPDGKTITVPANSYFVLGDNREHSLDSRNLGFIDMSEFTGRAWVIYWPPQNVGVIEHPNY